MKSLTLAFACIGERLPELLKNISSINLTSNIEIVILVQKPQNDTESIISRSTSARIKVLDTVGLSKSRNNAIKISTTDYIWFLDDDVQLNNTDIEAAIDIINAEYSEIYRVKIGCIEWPERTFKNYKKIKKIMKLNLLQVSSIEVIADLNFIKSNALKFNERIGLGTEYKACEENNFLIDAWEAGAKFMPIDKVIVKHTCVFDDRILANDKIFEIRGATASRFGVLGLMLILRWLVRYSIKEKKASYLKSLLRGYFRGYSQYS